MKFLFYDVQLSLSMSHQFMSYLCRDGYCRTDENDHGVHVVCATMTKNFLSFTKSRGNDLSSRRGGFPGLTPGDRWCLCAGRWREASLAGAAPGVVLQSTHHKERHQLFL